MRLHILLFLSIVSLLSGCASDDPTTTVQAYLEARVEADAVQMQQLACADFEDQARLQAESFRALNAELQDVSCETVSQTDSEATVRCDGQIVTSYDGENREFPLKMYSLVQSRAGWLMCGESDG